MPSIAIKAKTGTVTSRRDGVDIVIQKSIEKGTVIETFHGGTNKRARGKQAPKEPITLSAVELKAITKNAGEKHAKELAEAKETNKKNLMNMNIQANRATGTLEGTHRVEMKKVTGKLNMVRNKLAATKLEDKHNMEVWTRTRRNETNSRQSWKISRRR